MDIDNRNSQDAFIMAVLEWVPDVAISAAIMKLTDDQWQTFWIVFVAIQATYFLFWLKSALWGIIVWRAWGRRRETDRILAILRSTILPKPESSNIDTPGYFLELKTDESQPVAIRIFAAEFAVAYRALEFRG